MHVGNQAKEKKEETKEEKGKTNTSGKLI